MLPDVVWNSMGYTWLGVHDVGYDIPSLSARYCVLVLSMMTVVACTAGRITVVSLHV